MQRPWEDPITVCQTEQELTTLAAAWRQAGDRIVMTSGVFDLMHRGHVEEILNSIGGRAERVGHTDGYSTSALIKRITTRYAPPP